MGRGCPDGCVALWPGREIYSPPLALHVSGLTCCVYCCIEEMNSVLLCQLREGV